MMTNLFSTFDPSTSMNMSMNWVSTITCFMLIPLTYWTLPNRMSSMINMITNKLNEEFKMLMGPKSKGMTLMMISLFMFILINNLMGLLPYIFTSSSHLVFTLSLALPLWITLMLYGWINQTNHMFAHLIPAGTPAMLMPFMVMIETISNMIRPGSLAVRLTANMIAGHLLMSLLGNNSINSGVMLPMIMIVQIMLMMFETAVSLIQAYVFSVLSTLYSSEVM
uniref:ATP synthase F0 subunit 6 n=1 Tax=Leptocorisa oratoria TaxID=2724160 RepID=UPI001FA73D05|nr:ATP synthase F0 subunit 6 [Leptocorisa oratoria]YP_010315883.1 ATP synthase F0 subunit 6 [Leptocorisa chinensis]UNA68529.1 ATP synthase F0 subunit 6 [Leptocorisa chinensis]UNA68542.1 ATP synthase F0 subunit 6 [Leptocorisa chinensis]UNA68555.1 ATP synthase F0 subunit 6 [Leptocorisa chinensis]UNA68568.1 ATP synthase F0 subunit 6 [Leptocorisa chinensis]UNA68594.1 ATP synthase F0 subunit 6 [Leptocorisa chinensis]